jgi:NAD+ synthase
MRKKIIHWIKGQVRTAGAKGVIIGLSGGLDSCVVAGLAREALGKKRVLGLILPCHSQPRDLKDARLAAKKLGITVKVIDLSKIYDKLIHILPAPGALAKSNLKSRLRMIVFYYFANSLNYLVCGTSNKSEIFTGYFTKYGDGAADILPIAGLLKKQVRALAGELRVPDPIITKAPTAGLWPGQTDEGEMGITYPELDDIIERMEAGKAQVAARAKVNKVKTMFQRSIHKREIGRRP